MKPTIKMVGVRHLHHKTTVRLTNCMHPGPIGCSIRCRYVRHHAVQHVQHRPHKRHLQGLIPTTTQYWCSISDAQWPVLVKLWQFQQQGMTAKFRDHTSTTLEAANKGIKKNMSPLQRVDNKSRIGSNPGPIDVRLHQLVVCSVCTKQTAQPLPQIHSFS